MRAHQPWATVDPPPDQMHVRVEVLDELILTFDHQPWREHAACSSADVPLAWFFGDSSRDSVLNTRRARRVCAGCPVKWPCLAFGLDHEAQGVWAGTTEAQRKATAGMGFIQRIEYLLGEVRRLSSSGPWRSITPDEWKEQTG